MELTRIEQNEKLREKIVDLADIWDGKVSDYYGEVLTDILQELGIDDIPKFYTKERIDKIIEDLGKKLE